jgi:hypothetical protein
VTVYRLSLSAHHCVVFVAHPRVIDEAYSLAVQFSRYEGD